MGRLKTPRHFLTGSDNTIQQQPSDAPEQVQIKPAGTANVCAARVTMRDERNSRAAQETAGKLKTGGTWQQVRQRRALVLPGVLQPAVGSGKRMSRVQWL